MTATAGSTTSAVAIPIRTEPKYKVGYFLLCTFCTLYFILVPLRLLWLSRSAQSLSIKWDTSCFILYAVYVMRCTLYFMLYTFGIPVSVSRNPTTSSARTSVSLASAVRTGTQYKVHSVKYTVLKYKVRSIKYKVHSIKYTV